jgi:hypothetical protein
VLSGALPALAAQLCLDPSRGGGDRALTVAAAAMDAAARTGGGDGAAAELADVARRALAALRGES